MQEVMKSITNLVQVLDEKKMLQIRVENNQLNIRSYMYQVDTKIFNK